MKNAVKFLSLALLFMLIFGVSVADAQSTGSGDYGMTMHDTNRGMGTGHVGMMPENLMEARHQVMALMMGLGVDDKQMESIQKIIDTTVKEMIRKRSDLLIAEIDLEGILFQEPVDLKAAEAKMRQIEGMKTELFMTHLKAFEEVKALLTPDQKGKLNEMMEMQMMGGMGMMRNYDYSEQEDKKADEKTKKQ
jgi:Spy/CpxP family protein refolding chaperone